jgi:hypothetical protein
MNIYLLYANDLLKITSVAILSYITLVSLYKFIKGKEYSITDFRMSVFGLIFLFFKISGYLALVLIGEKTLSTEFTYAVIAFILAMIGWYMHNKESDIRKKHFRIFFFYEIGLILILLSF